MVQVLLEHSASVRAHANTCALAPNTDATIMAVAVRSMGAVEIRFISCEDDVEGFLYNFWCTITSVPILAVPLSTIWKVSERRGSVALHLWALSFLAMFLHNLLEHSRGPQTIHLETVSRLQEALLGLVLMQSRLGKLPVKAVAATAAVVLSLGAACTFALEWQAHVDAVLGAIYAPFVISQLIKQTAGRPVSRSWLRRALLGVFLIVLFVAVEERLCQALPLPELHHALVGHAIILFLMGSQSELVLAIALPSGGHRAGQASSRP